MCVAMPEPAEDTTLAPPQGAVWGDDAMDDLPVLIDWDDLTDDDMPALGISKCEIYVDVA